MSYIDIDNIIYIYMYYLIVYILYGSLWHCKIHPIFLFENIPMVAKTRRMAF